MAGWIVLAFWMAANCNSARPNAFNHLRSNETFLRDVVIEGYARSGTFRDLVDATERLSCIVYVTIAVNMPAGMRGALLLRPAGRSARDIDQHDRKTADPERFGEAARLVDDFGKWMDRRVGHQPFLKVYDDKRGDWIERGNGH